MLLFIFTFNTFYRFMFSSDLGCVTCVLSRLAIVSMGEES